MFKEADIRKIKPNCPFQEEYRQSKLVKEMLH
jgi:hypothetical protein